MKIISFVSAMFAVMIMLFLSGCIPNNYRKGTSSMGINTSNMTHKFRATGRPFERECVADVNNYRSKYRMPLIELVDQNTRGRNVGQEFLSKTGIALAAGSIGAFAGPVTKILAFGAVSGLASQATAYSDDVKLADSQVQQCIEHRVYTQAQRQYQPRSRGYGGNTFNHYPSFR